MPVHALFQTVSAQNYWLHPLPDSRILQFAPVQLSLASFLYLLHSQSSTFFFSDFQLHSEVACLNPVPSARFICGPANSLPDPWICHLIPLITTGLLPKNDNNPPWIFHSHSSKAPFLHLLPQCPAGIPPYLLFVMLQPFTFWWFCKVYTLMEILSCLIALIY